MLLSEVPEIHGRSPAGVSATSSGQAPPTTSIAAPPAEQLAQRREPRPRGATQSQASAIAGTTTSATPIFVSKPSPTAIAAQHEPARAAVLERRGPRTRPPRRSSSVSSASGLLSRDIATAIGVVASASPADEAPERGRTAAARGRRRGPRSRRPSAPRARGSPAGGSRTPAPRAPEPTATAAACRPSSRRSVERGVEEVVPARRHRAHGRRVVGVGPAVLAERPQVQQRARPISPPSSGARRTAASAPREAAVRRGGDRPPARSPPRGPGGLGLEDVAREGHRARTGCRGRISQSFANAENRPCSRGGASQGLSAPHERPLARGVDWIASTNAKEAPRCDAHPQDARRPRRRGSARRRRRRVPTRRRAASTSGRPARHNRQHERQQRLDVVRAARRRAAARPAPPERPRGHHCPGHVGGSAHGRRHGAAAGTGGCTDGVARSPAPRPGPRRRLARRLARWRDGRGRSILRRSADVAQLARASACHAEGRGFESLHPL